MRIILEQNKNVGGIYQIQNITNARIYIGSTSSFRKRATEHKRLLLSGKANSFLQNDWNKCGSGAFEYSILEVIIGDKGARLAAEQRFLDKFYDGQDKCYNINRLASSRKGSVNVWTEEQHKACSEERSARYKNPEYLEKIKVANKKKYEENKEETERCLAIGRAMHLGVPKSKEHSEKISATRKRLKIPSPMQGKHLSKTAKEKISQSREKIYDVKVVSPEGEIYGSITNLKQFCIDHDLNQGCMWMVVCRGKKFTKGWTLLSSNGPPTLAH